MIDLDLVLPLAKVKFELDFKGVHGIEHWLNVTKMAQTIVAVTGGDYVVATLFGIFHDCCRISDYEDVDHGLRAAEYVKTLNLDITPDQNNSLIFAIRNHNLNVISNDPTVGACWDADRLELSRIGIYPQSKQLSTLTGIHILNDMKQRRQSDFLTEMAQEPETVKTEKSKEISRHWQEFYPNFKKQTDNFNKERLSSIHNDKKYPRN